MSFDSCPPIFTCELGVPVIEISIDEAEYDQRVWKFVTIKPKKKCRKIRTISEFINRLNKRRFNC